MSSDTDAASADQCPPAPDQSTEVRVALPLPLDVTASLMAAVAALYPSATVSGTGSALIFNISKHDRCADTTHITASLEQVSPTRPSLDDRVVALLTAVDDGTFEMTVPEYLGTLLSGLATRALNAENAPNYLAIKMRGPAGLFEIIVCRPGRPSPHELRELAEERAKRYAAALRAAGIDPTNLD